jgi:threonylcarbamoyladenosine tRNA methylthiotransferase MtaB
LARGSSRSRPVSEIVEEAAALAGPHPEIVVTGIHIGSYGADIGSSLGELLETLVQSVATVRFRLTSIEATEVDSRLADLLTGDSSRVAPHLHAPLQSGSNAILRRMGRNWYDAESYFNAVARIVGKASTFALSGDVIAGFPGETDDDHRATVQLVRNLPFNSLHVFPYSPRPGTAATRLGKQVHGSVARERAAELRQVASEKKSLYESSRAGGNCDVVMIERGRGLTEDYLSVEVSDASIPRRGRFTGTLRTMGGVLTAVPHVPLS